MNSFLFREWCTYFVIPIELDLEAWRGPPCRYARLPNMFIQSIRDIQILRYAAVGVMNTCLTAAVIFIFMHLSFGVYSSNAIGYACGILFSFIANALFTFSVRPTSHRFAKFLAVCLVCWLVNLLAMKIFFWFFPFRIYTGQIIGMMFYTGSSFLINKWWAMR